MNLHDHDLPFELESEQYWEYVDWVLQAPSFRASQSYVRPIIQLRELLFCEEPETRDEDCTCNF